MNEAGRVQHEEDSLVHAAQSGDRRAFASLYETNVSRVYRYLRARVPQPADAEDITAEVFIKAMQALPSYRTRGSPFVAWLYRIAHNELADHFKRRERRQEAQLQDDVQPRDSTAGDPSEQVIAHIAAGEVHELMQRLTDLQQQVLALRFGAELSIAETAAAMDRSENAVKFLQHSAIRALQRVLRGKESSGHGG